MKTDRELLELAAKAAGVVTSTDSDTDELLVKFKTGLHGHQASVFNRTWNPLTDDGDALRLAVNLRIDLDLWIRTDQVIANNHAGDNWISLTGKGRPSVQREHSEPRGADEYAATRRAVVRAAAAIGETL